MTFHRDGTMTAAANAPGGSPFDTPEYGSWQREPGSQNYSFRAVSYGYDENGAFTGRGEITATITLAADGNSFTWDDNRCIRRRRQSPLLVLRGGDEDAV
jgi:hypothetical protein